MLVGSDYPFDMGDDQPAEIVKSLNLNQASEEKILFRNAQQLFGLEG